MSDTKSDFTATATPVSAPPAYDATAHTARPKAPPPSTGPRPLPPLDLPILAHLRATRTILASTSPRRRTLLSQLGLPKLEILPSNHPEDLPKADYTTPWEYCLATASAKALAAYRIALDDGTGRDPGVVIAADTIVVGSGGEVLEKPRSERQHVEMLRALRDGGRMGLGSAERSMVEAAARQVESMGLGGGMRGESAVQRVAPVRGGAGGLGGQGREAGGWHKVYTAVAVCAPLESARDPGYALETTVEETGVRFAADGMFARYVHATYLWPSANHFHSI